MNFEQVCVRIRCILDDTDDEDVFEENDSFDFKLSDSEIEDATIESDHDTETEKENESDEEMYEDEQNILLGRDGITKWNKEIANIPERTRVCNLVSLPHLPGPLGAAKYCTTPLEQFLLFLDVNILTQIVINTNLYIVKVCDQFDRDRDVKQTDIDEIKAFIGLLLLSGAFKSSKLNLKKLWRRNGLGIEIFWATMSLRRFNFLLCCLRFDNYKTRSSRRKIDKLAPIRNIFDSFVDNCKEYYCLGEYTTIDEQLIDFSGKCPFKQYMPRKLAKYGIKLFALCDARTWYISTLEIYAGQQPDGPYLVSNSASDVVERLVKTIRNSGRNITIDNWFCSIPLAKNLLEQRLTIVGTLRTKEHEIPSTFLNVRVREINSSKFAFQDNLTLVSYVPRKMKNVLLISTMHSGGIIDADTGKPEIISFYNITKSGVDMADKMIRNYSTSRKTNRWPMRVFFHILDTAVFNSLVLHISNSPGIKTNHNTFTEEIGLSLIKPFLKTRSELPYLPVAIRQVAARISGTNLAVNTCSEPGPSRPYKSRCRLCPRIKDVKTTTFCYLCNVFMCKKHMQYMCTNCLEDHNYS